MNAMASRKPKGFAAFSMIWSTQLFSILASSMTGFALTIWMYQQTQSATAMAAVQVFFMVPFMVMSFFAGPMVDRYNRRAMMAMSDSISAIGTFGLMLAYFFGVMQPWMLYAGAIFLGIGNAFQWPAYSATISMIVPKKQLGRANGMMTLLDAGPAVFAPLLAGALMPFIGIAGIMAIDAVTYLMAVSVLFLVEIPNPERSAEGERAKGNLVKEALWGYRYILERPSLLALQLFLLAGNIISGIGLTLMPTMILARSGTDSLVFGGIQTVGAIGGIVGGLVLSAWGGFKRKSFGVALGWFLMGVGGVALGLAQGFWAWAAAAAFLFAFSPLINAHNQSLWMAKVSPDLQGRVFGARRMIAQLMGPIVPMVAGPLADFVMEPAMRDASAPLAPVLGPIFGVGPGAGMSVLISASSLVLAAVALAAWSLPLIRNADTFLPDWDDGEAAAPVESAPEPEVAKAPLPGVESAVEVAEESFSA